MAGVLLETTGKDYTVYKVKFFLGTGHANNRQIEVYLDQHRYNSPTKLS